MPTSDTFCPSSQASTWTMPLREIKALDILAFLVPVTQFMEIKVVGRLFMPDVLLACMLPMLIAAHGKRLRARMPMIFILLASFWLLGQVVTDMVRGTIFHDYTRGWAKIGFTLVNFCALYLLLYGNQRRLILYTLGLATGVMLNYFVNPNWYAEDYPWKFGYGASITWFLILLAVAIFNRRSIGPYLSISLLFAAAVLNIFMDFRSLGGICFLAACYLFVQAQWGPQVAKLYTRPWQIILIGVVLVTAGLGIFQLYNYAARTGMLGEDAQQKYQAQASGEYGLFLGGRSEVLASSRAISESPIVGHGSWAKDYEYSSLLNELRQQAGYAPGPEHEEGLIPTHSHLLGAWVEAGILGAILWVWVLSLPVRALFVCHGKIGKLSPLMAFVAFFLIWDILFSPYGAELRFKTPYYVVFMMTYLGACYGKFGKQVSK